MNDRFFSPRAPQTLLEAALLGVLLSAALVQLDGWVSPDVINSGVFVSAALYSAWAAGRWRIPQGSFLRQAFCEAAMAPAVGVLLGIIVADGARLIGLSAVLERNVLPADMGTLAADFAVIGLVIYPLLRAGRRFWKFWVALWKRRLVWSITHAQLIMAVGLAFAVGCVLQLIILQPDYTGDFAPGAVTGPWLVTAAAWLISSIIPTLSVMIVFTCAGLVVLLPLASAISYLIARRTTRRVEALARAAREMGAGRYQARVAPEGEDEISQMQSDFNRMAAALETAMRDLEAERDRVADLLTSRQAMTASVSHELRTPLAALRAYLETACRIADIPDGLRRDLDRMEQETQRLQSLVDDLFTLSRVDSGGWTIRCEAVDAAALVRRVAERMSPPAWQTRRVQIGVESEENLPPAWADAGRLEQVLANLVRNAVRHSPPRGNRRGESGRRRGGDPHRRSRFR
ncbi:MAG: HAMP domain-containing protein [Anaerolineales bacterium]|nr:HAMP domain-containing protein [Anaerolineales bacterium]